MVMRNLSKKINSFRNVAGYLWKSQVGTVTVKITLEVSFAEFRRGLYATKIIV